MKYNIAIQLQRIVLIKNMYVTMIFVEVMQNFIKFMIKWAFLRIFLYSYWYRIFLCHAFVQGYVNSIPNEINNIRILQILILCLIEFANLAKTSIQTLLSFFD